MIGQTVSHYTILEKLGEGGMGVVYKAQDTRLDRIVALKFLPAGVGSSPDDIARFEQEAKAISALNHPNIATIYDVGEANGRKFLVLEYIPGGTLKSQLKTLLAGNRDFSIEDVISYGIQLAEGLACAHGAGIIHRDVKSDNAMLTREGNVKLTDFGLAKLQNAAPLTKIGSTVGTAAYMSPEQMRGEDVDGRSDLFSLGVVLYELTTMHLPFRGDHDAALAYSILNEDPQPAGSFRANIPEALSSVITQCLEKDPLKRYQTADGIARDLRNLNREAAGTAKAVAVRRRSTVPWMIVAAVVVLGAIGISLFMSASHPSGTNSKTIAVLPFTNLSQEQGEEYLSDGMTEDILAQLVKIADLKVISRTTMMQYKGAKKSLKEIGKELNAQALLEGSVRRAGDQIRIVAQLIDATNDHPLWSETYDREFKQVFSIQSEIAQRIALSLQAALSPVEKERLSKPATVNPEAYTAYLQGRYFSDRKSKEDLEKAINYFEHALTIEPAYARAWVGLSLAHGTQADYSYVTVEEGYGKARTEGEKALILDPNIADAHTNMGWIRKNFDLDWTGADSSFRRAVELEPRNAAAVRGASSLAFSLGRFDEAITLGKRAIELDPLLPSGYYNLGTFEYYAGHLSKAETAFMKALELSPGYPVAHSWLGRVYLAQSRQQDALAAIQKETDSVYLLQGRVVAYHSLGKNKEAGTALAELITKYQDPSAFQIAEVFAYLGETDTAFAWLERAYRQRDGGVSAMKGNPLMRGIEKDPRYAAFMKKIGLPP